MTQNAWRRLGPREKQILAVLRRAESPLTTREVLTHLQQDGTEIAYTTISTIMTRLVEKELVIRTEETHAGSLRYRHAFQPAAHRAEFVDTLVEDVSKVLGNPGLRLLAQCATERQHDSGSHHVEPTEHNNDS